MSALYGSSDLDLIFMVHWSLLVFLVYFRMNFKTVWLWPLIDTLNSSIDWDNLRERLSVTTTVHDVPAIDI